MTKKRKAEKARVVCLFPFTNLSGDCNFVVGLVAEWALPLVSVVKGDGDSCLGDACLARLVDQLLKTAGTHLWEVCMCV